MNINIEWILSSIPLIKSTQLKPKSFFNVIQNKQTTAFYMCLFVLFLDGTFAIIAQ